MKLGAFSVSLAVKDIEASITFYENLGFSKFHGDQDQGWVILANDQTKIGLFQNMFEKNMLTFNPGWDSQAQPLDDFTDIREIQTRLKETGTAFVTEADEESQGAASFLVLDPDGNPILVDQHV